MLYVREGGNSAIQKQQGSNPDYFIIKPSHVKFILVHIIPTEAGISCISPHE